MPLQIVRNNIVLMETDAIVNAANSQLQRGGGVCGAIFEASDAKKLQKACNAIGHCPPGSAVITRSYGLKAKRIIHAVGPVWKGGTNGEEALLRSAYLSALRLAKSHRLHSIAFPLLSSGIYGYPKDQALKVALSTIQEFLLNEGDLDVSLVVFDKSAFALSEKLMNGVKSYIDEHYVKQIVESEFYRRRNFQHEFSSALYSRKESAFSEYSFDTSEYLDLIEKTQLDEADTSIFDDIPSSYDDEPIPPKDEVSPSAVSAHSHPFCAPSRSARENLSRPALSDLDKFLSKVHAESFSDMLMRLIDERGFEKDSIVYKRANLDRFVFSKLRSRKGYTPTKPTILAFAIALELNMDQTLDLLRAAGYALSPNNLTDVIVSYFIEQRIYDIFEVNAALFAYDCPCLGSKG